MKSKMNIKSIVFMAIIAIISLFFINMSLAANNAKIIVETANLRESADENSKILEQLSINQEVEVLEKSGDWYKVKSKGITGYVRNDLLSVNEEKQETSNTTNTNNTENNNVSNDNTNTNQEANTTETKENEIKLGKQKIAENTRLKIVPLINATDLIEVKKDEEVNVTEILNDWLYVEAQNTKGWIRKEKIKTEETEKQEEQPKVEETAETEKVIKTQYVSSEKVNLRKEASTSSEVVASLPVNTAVDVVKEENGWSKVKVSGKEGYISTSLLSSKKKETSRSMETPRKATENKETKQETKKETTSNASVAPSGNGSAVVAYAKTFIGTKYTYGGSSPSTGFDCSGFTSYVYKNFGVSLPRTSGGQAGVGTAVSRENLAAGDLVIYSGHVAIYVGGGQVIHSPKPGKTVCIVPLNQAAGNYKGARRII